MPKTYKRIATVEFAVPFTDQRVTVSDLSYTYCPARGETMDSQAVFAASKFLRSHGFNSGLDTVCIQTSPDKAPLIKAIEASDQIELVHVS